jgi:hypothetical protein
VRRAGAALGTVLNFVIAENCDASICVSYTRAGGASNLIT